MPVYVSIMDSRLAVPKDFPLVAGDRLVISAVTAIQSDAAHWKYQFSVRAYHSYRSSVV